MFKLKIISYFYYKKFNNLNGVWRHSNLQLIHVRKYVIVSCLNLEIVWHSLITKLLIVLHYLTFQKNFFKYFTF